MKSLLFILFTFITLLSQAATITVQNTNNTGAGSLRDAISTSAPGDTIRFNPNLIASGSATITLTSEIAFGKNLTIIGLYNSSDTLFVSGNSTNRIFNVDLSSSADKSIKLDSVILINGNGGTGRGGAINMLNVTDLEITNSIIKNNLAGDGGGIYSRVNDINTTILINNSIFTNNTASADGGGFYFYQNSNNTGRLSQVNITNSEFSYNSAAVSGGEGAGFRLACFGTSLTLDLTNSSIHNNSGWKGGGIDLDAANLTSTIISSTISNNTASTRGGGINLSSNSSFGSATINLNITTSTIAYNSATNEGGAINMQSSNFSGAGSFNNLNLNYSTLAFNTGGGSGLHSQAITASSLILNSNIIVFNNTNNIDNSSQPITSFGYNIVSDASLIGISSTDIITNSTSLLNLGPLQNNGGTTETILPGTGSIAIDFGNPSITTDAQNSRIKNGRRDAGAAETNCFLIDNKTVLGCDSIVYKGTSYFSSQIIYDTVKGNISGNCDSAISLNLVINNSTSSTDVQIACDSYTWIDGMTYTASNNFATYTLQNIDGCDSIVTLNLTINNSTGSTDTQIACDSYIWIDGNVYTSSNNSAIHTLINSKGCDSIVMLDLTIKNSTTSVDVQNHCGSYTWINGVTYTSSNMTAKDTIVGGNSEGCDSIISLNLVIRNSSTSTETITACDSYTWRNGMTYTATNTTAKDTTFNSVGCDSIITLNLTINSATSSTDMQVHCETYIWIDGITYTSSNNSATHTLTNAKGCDSIVTLDLIINNATTSTDIQSHCGSYTWIDGNTYTASNSSATHTLTNSKGCDSIVMLDLTINNSTSSVDVQNHCGSYTWINGVTYTTSNTTATDTLTNAAGCDSIIALNLVIRNSSISIETIAACDSYTWRNGVIYTASNSTAKDTIFNSTGCDSIISLNLTITNSTSSTDVQTACNSYTWIDGNTYTSSNNFATHTLTNSAGCDSIVTLNLTIIRTNSSSDIQTACGSYTWINGVTYTVSNNTAKDTLTNTAGCDSIISLYLTINTVNTAVTRIGVTLTATTTGANYQWIDCDNGNTAITGATNQSFIAATNGNYAVIIIENGCTDTSACTSVNSVGVKSVSNSIEWNLFPNPASNKVTLTFSQEYEKGSVKIFNPFGKLVYEGNITEAQTNLTLDISQYANGMYTIVVVSGSRHTNKKLIINR